MLRHDVGCSGPICVSLLPHAPPVPNNFGAREAVVVLVDDHHFGGNIERLLARQPAIHPRGLVPKELAPPYLLYEAMTAMTKLLLVDWGQTVWLRRSDQSEHLPFPFL